MTAKTIWIGNGCILALIGGCILYMSVFVDNGTERMREFIKESEAATAKIDRRMKAFDAEQAKDKADLKRMNELFEIKPRTARQQLELNTIARRLEAKYGDFGVVWDHSQKQVTGLSNEAKRLKELPITK